MRLAASRREASLEYSDPEYVTKVAGLFVARK
jgi:hypothetical protein